MALGRCDDQNDDVPARHSRTAGSYLRKVREDTRADQEKFACEKSSVRDFDHLIRIQIFCARSAKSENISMKFGPREVAQR